ncbi:MAG: hypothetical protein WBE11_18520 [Candidatus Aminicenantaceae bacterium]
MYSNSCILIGYKLNIAIFCNVTKDLAVLGASAMDGFSSGSGGSSAGAASAGSSASSSVGVGSSGGSASAASTGASVAYTSIINKHYEREKNIIC